MDILIPCKGLGAGKSRLASCLGPRQRRDLCGQLLAATLRTAVQLAGADSVHVVTSDGEAAAAARRAGARLITDPGRGLNSALDAARATLVSQGRDDLLLVPTDLPYLDLSSLSEVTDRNADIVIAPDERRTGTNLLRLRGKGCGMPLAYGEGSFGAHLAAARARGLSAHVIRNWRTAFDLDEPVQYFRWMAAAGPLAVAI